MGRGTDIVDTVARPSRRRPRDAAAMLLIDRTGPEARILVGKRSSRHVFMPELYVFPGGRRDRGDNSMAITADFHPLTLARLTGDKNSVNERRLRGLAVCALRELQEETGLAVLPATGADLSQLRYVARAITPPGNPRRYDTYFFACFTDEVGIDASNIKDSTELSDVRFIPTSGVDLVPMPEITQLILGHLHSIVTSDPSLQFGSPIPFYTKRYGRHVRDMI